MNINPVLKPARFLRLAQLEFTNIGRDPTLLVISVLAVLPTILFVLYHSSADLAAQKAFDLFAISRYAAPVFLILPAYLIGWVFGFLMLEERDDGPLRALGVSPVGKTGIMLFRSILSFVFSAGIAAFSGPLILPNLSFALWSGLAVLTGLQSASLTLALPAFAANKVQGLALTKVMNLFAVLPLLAAIPSPFRFVFGFLPPFWIGEIAGLSDGAVLPTGVSLFLALACHGLFVMYFFAHLGKRGCQN